MKIKPNHHNLWLGFVTYNKAYFYINSSDNNHVVTDTQHFIPLLDYEKKMKRKESHFDLIEESFLKMQKQ